jgi:hypothetical protein
MRKSFDVDHSIDSKSVATTEELLETIFLGYVSKNGTLPQPILDGKITTSIEASNYWISIQKAMDSTEQPREIPLSGRKPGMRWINPYQQRIEYNLNLFLTLSDIDKTFILNAYDHGICWNGSFWDDTQPLKLFRIIVKEALKANEDIQAYKQLAFDRMKQVLVKVCEHQ